MTDEEFKWRPLSEADMVWWMRQSNQHGERLIATAFRYTSDKRERDERIRSLDLNAGEQ